METKLNQLASEHRMAIGELQARDNKDSARDLQMKEADSKYREKYH